jgi:signal transduction histidine kinase
VQADGARLLQVLINLLANAVRFTPDGGRVRLSCDTQVDGHCGFRVSDTGPGIPKDKFDAIFHPYVQLEMPVAGHAGSGLGLAISREFVSGMQGELSVESEIGKGSTFIARFPLHAGELVT